MSLPIISSSIGIPVFIPLTKVYYLLDPGKVRKKYETFMVPYEKLKSLADAELYLKPGVSFAYLDKIAYAQSDNEFGRYPKHCSLFRQD